MVAALTLLPAVLRLLGDRVNRGPLLSRRAHEDTHKGLWARAVHVAMRRQAISAAVAWVARLPGWDGRSVLEREVGGLPWDGGGDHGHWARVLEPDNGERVGGVGDDGFDAGFEAVKVGELGLDLDDAGAVLDVLWPNLR
jgi:hypothetical protein